jgi:hypothetical protein
MIEKKSLTFSWEGPFLFMKYLDGNEFQEHDEGGRIFFIKRKDKKLWDTHRRDLHVYHVAL